MQKNKTIWALALNGASALLYHVDLSARRLEPLALEPCQREAVPGHRDRPVRTFQSVGARRGSGEDLKEAEKMAERRFIEAVSRAVAAHGAAGRFDALVLACGPQCLGLVRAVAPPAFWDRVTREVRGDYAKAAPEDLYPLIVETLRFGQPPE